MRELAYIDFYGSKCLFSIIPLSIFDEELTDFVNIMFKVLVNLF